MDESNRYWEAAGAREEAAVAAMTAAELRRQVLVLATARRIEQASAAARILRRGDGLVHERDPGLSLHWHLAGVGAERRWRVDGIELGWRAADALTG